VFDTRYHALSLVAVLIALVVGLLLGIAVGDANLVSSGEKTLRRSLNHEVVGQQTANARLSDQLAFRRRFEGLLYPEVVAGRLTGKHIGLLFLGSPSDQVNALVRAALEGSGADLGLVAVVREPPDLGGLGARAGASRYSTLASRPDLVRPFGMRIGVQLARGGPQLDQQLLGRVRGRLLSSYNGSLQTLEGVVVMRAGSGRGPAGATSDLETGLMSGLTATNVPVVGVETSHTAPSQVTWYRQQNLASVDNLDDLAGQAALVLALGGAHGAYGAKSTAESLLPPAG